MIRSFLAAALTVGLANFALAVDKAYFDIKSVQVTDVTAQYPQTWTQGGLVENCNTAIATLSGKTSLNPIEMFDSANLILDQVINLGKKIFAVLEMGRPVVNMQFDTANALPKGLTCWSDLSGWKVPQSKVYNVTYKNGFGMNVVDFSYRIIFTAGGGFDGVGQYVTNATFLPASVNVGWGFNLDAKARIPSVFNMGTLAAPVGGLQMDLAWEVKTVMSHVQATESYHVNGANQLVKMQ